MLYDIGHISFGIQAIFPRFFHKILHAFHHDLDLTASMGHEDIRQAANRYGNIEEDKTRAPLRKKKKYVGRHRAKIKNEIEADIRHWTKCDVLISTQLVVRQEWHDGMPT